MRAQKQQHHLLLLPSLVIAFHFLPPAPLLNAALSGPAYSTPSCSTSANHISTTCSSKKLNISFPFFTSAECHNSESSFIISHCEPSNAFPDWPAFTKDATKGSALNSTVAIMYTPLPTGPLESQNSSPFSGFPFDPRSGYIALAWSSGLLDQPVCSTLADREQISQYIPHSINLQEFAHSAFNFDSSTIILLFSCNPTKINPSSYVQMNGSACTAYEKECKPNKDQSYNCYQYMASNPSKELSLPQLMNTSGCKQAMFFVAIDQSSVLLTWKPGAILLNWKATGTEWLASAFQACARCLASNGSCGYDSRGEFDCSCGIDCSYQKVRPASPSPQPDALPSPPNTTGASNHKSSRTRTVIISAAGCFAMVLFMSLGILAMFCFCKRKKAGGEAWCSSEYSHKSWIKKPSFLSRKQDATLAKEISYKELVQATETFADKNILGDGGFGAVYGGILADGLKVAVKRLHHDNYRRIEHFSNEIKVLSNLNHPNLVKLFGFCASESERELLLVFEYAPQGTVSDHLHGGLKPPMTWSLRLKIACETADALSYLHNAVNPPIYHRDVKTANILLDDAFHAKLCDFGLSKLVPIQATHITTSPQGTPGYLDPEYHECYQLTDKSDVYSLGVVLMELVSGKLAVDMSRERGEINLSTMAVMKIQCGLLEELVDPNLEMNKDPNVESSIKRVVELAFRCLHGCRDDRPSMTCIAETLANIHRELEGAAIATEKTPFSSPQSVFFFSGSSCPSSSRSSS